MKNQIVALLLSIPAIGLCQSETYQPDYDSDGCITVVDLTAFLSGFGSCDEASDTTAFQCGEAVSRQILFLI